MKIVDSSTMARIDREAQQEYSIPGVILMENAGLKAYELLRALYWNGAEPAGTTAYVVGKGNNGGDALVIARQLHLDGYRGGAIVAAASPDETQIGMCRRLGVPLVEWPSPAARRAIASADVIIDGLTGTGIKGALRAPFVDVVKAVNGSAAFTVAVDVPSGIGDGYRNGMPAVRADVTVTMGLPKLALYLPFARPNCGTIHVIRLGFPAQLVEDVSIPGTLLDAEEATALAPPVPPAAYKNVRGTVCVFAGSEGTTGAAVLAARAAAHCRAGLVTLFIEREVYSAAASQLSSVMVRPVDYRAAPKELQSPVPIERFDARVVGPGWGRAETRRRWLENLVASGRGVLDADGLSILAEDDAIPRPFRHPWVLTPHPGEFSRLLGAARDEILADPLHHVLDAAASFGSVVVLKSHVTYIGSPSGRYWILDGMNPALGTGGSGDVLAGAIGGLLAGGLSSEAAACAAVFAHHQAGKRAYQERGWFTAEELIPYLSQEVRFDEKATRVRGLSGSE